MEMRLRLPELLEDRGLTAYAVAQRSGERIDTSTLYRLIRQKGRVKYFAADVCQALCDVLNVTHVDLFETDPARDKPKRGREAK